MITTSSTTPTPARSDTAAGANGASSTTSATTSSMEATAAGRRADGQRRHERVLAVISAALAAGDPAALAVAGVARAAGVHRSYLYRHPELVELLQDAARTPGPGAPPATERVTVASLRADLAHARDRATRAETEARALRHRLSEALGQQIWADTGLGPTDEAASLRADLERLRQDNADLAEALDDREGELDAARAANRELMAQLNAPPTTSSCTENRVSSRPSS